MMRTKTKRRISGGALAIGVIVVGSLAAILIRVRVAAPSQVRVFRGHTGALLSLAWSPDGKRLVSGGWDKTARVWNVATGRTERIFGGSRGEVDSVAYSPDGVQIAVGSLDATVQVWEAATGASVGPRLYHHSYVPDVLYTTNVAYSPDGKYIASSGIGERTVKLWNARTLRLTHTLAGHKEWSGPLAFSPDGKTIATGDQAKAHLWDTATGKRRRTISSSGPYVSWLVFAPNSKTILCDNSDFGSISDVATGALRSTFGGNDIRSAHFSPDGQTLATATDFEVQLRSARTGALHTTLVRLPRPPPRGVRRSLLAKWFPGLFPPPRFATYDERITAMQWSPNGKTIAYASGKNVYLVAVP